jgi:2-oxoisovalerate dehydrogenase E2 component (dihydrolipoyl transacylase)
MAEVEVKLPSLGADAGDEARVSFWYVDVGEEIEKDADLLQMLTDKATFDVPSPVGGRITAVVAEENQMIKVGDVLCRVDVKG